MPVINLAFLPLTYRTLSHLANPTNPETQRPDNPSDRPDNFHPPYHSSKKIPSQRIEHPIESRETTLFQLSQRPTRAPDERTERRLVPGFGDENRGESRNGGGGGGDY